MKLSDAEQLAYRLMAEHDLIEQGWVFRFDRSTVRFGNCRFGNCRFGTPPTISLSRHLVALNDAADVEDTIRHEIAHALAGLKAGHGPQWKSACALTGARPDRVYDSAVIATPKPPWLLVCPDCGASFPRRRRSNSRFVHRCGTSLVMVWKENR